jgi:hypothetical protein
MEKRRIAGLLLILYGIILPAYTVTFMFMEHVVSTYVIKTLLIAVESLLMAAGFLLLVSRSECRADHPGGILIMISGGIWTAESVLDLIDLVVPLSMTSYLFISSYVAAGCLLAAGIVFFSISGAGTKSRVVGIMLLLFAIVYISLTVILSAPISSLLLAPLPTPSRSILYAVLYCISISMCALFIVAGVLLRITYK